MASRVATGRAIAIAVGLLLALLAAWLVWRYVNTADERAQEGTRPVDVYVATQAIASGTTFADAVAQDAFEQVEYPVRLLPDDAVTDLSQITEQVAATDILADEPIRVAQWSETSPSNLEVPVGLVGLSLQVGLPEGAAGNLAAGDRIAILAHIAAPDPGAEQDGDTTGATETRAQFVVEEAEVLSIGRQAPTIDTQATTQGSVEQTDQVLMTVAVTPQDAEKLVFSSNEGLLHVTVLPDEGDLGDTPGRTFADLFGN